VPQKDPIARRETVRKYNASEKHRVAALRYRATAKGKAANRRANEKRVVVAQRCFYLKTKAQRDQVHAHIQKRRYEFEQGFESRAETESRTAGAVQTETEPRAHRF
jgi:hypothetical protein